MRRVFKWMLGIVLVLLAIPLLAVVAILVLANTNPGRHLIESQTASLTGGMVTLQGLTGRFPDRLRVARIAVSDAKGPYVTVSDVVLDWSPLRLLSKTADVGLLQANTLEVSRLPESSGSKQTSSSGSFNLPVQVEVHRLTVSQAIIGAPVAGAAARLSLTGSAQIESLQDGTVQLDVERLDSPGHYAVSGTLTPQTAVASLQAKEPAKGLISTAAHLPDLGAIALQASVNGPRERLATQLALQAGQLAASANGTVDLVHQAADLAIKAQAPAMTPAPGISWQSVLVDMKVDGPFSTPEANGVVRIAALNAAGARIGALDVNASGSAAQAKLHAVVQDLHIPGPRPDLFAAAPVTLDATAQLQAAERPVAFAVQHKLLSLEGTAQTAGTETVKAHLVVPDITPFAAIGGTDLQGKLDLVTDATMQNGTTAASVSGLVAITGGKAPIPALIGDACHIEAAGSVHGQDMTLTRLAVNGKALTVSAGGTLLNQVLNADWSVALADLAAVQPSVSGKIAAHGTAQGRMDAGKISALGVQADIAADVAAHNFQPGHVDAHVVASGLPDAPQASVNATGTLLDAPLTLVATGAKSDAGISADITQAAWKSLTAHGSVQLPANATLPLGSLSLNVARLADFTPLVGRSLQGQAAMDLDSTDQEARLALTMQGVSVPGTAAVKAVALRATVSDPAQHPVVDATLSAQGVSAASVAGASARVTVKGPVDALGLVVAAEAPDLAGGPARLDLGGTADAQNRTLNLARMETSWKQQTVRLLAPAKLNFADGVAMDRVRLGYRQAELALAGRVGSTLDLTATLRNLPADVAAIASPSLAANGVITADAHLTGTSAAPEGTIRVSADKVQLRQGPGAGLPPANVTANAALHGTSAHIDTRLVAGASHVTASGTVPIAAGGSMNVNTEGRIDLAMLNPLLTAEGRQVRGEVTLHAVATGTTAAPQVQGTAELTNGDIADYTYGAHIRNLTALVQASGNTIRLARLRGVAGQGTIGGDGTVSLAGDMPVDLRFTADNARPLTGPLIAAVLDANLNVRGAAKGDMQAAGTVHIRNANIQIPDTLPTSVAVLPVRQAGAPPPPPASTQPQSDSHIALDITISAPEQVFIRGRGLFAEVGGTIHIGGTTTDMNPSGGLNLRRGQFTVIGTSLNFTQGTVSFSGGGISDPSIHFVATSQTATMTAILTVSGTAKHPQITLSSTPEMPQDEILAQLLFQTDTSKLSPLQLAEIASALASLSGATSGVGDPLEAARHALGLDRLAIGSDSAGNPMLEAGRYVARGVYVGAKQGASGSGTQATVQVDLLKGLKLETSAGELDNNATGSTTGTQGASVGLTYQFQY